MGHLTNMYLPLSGRLEGVCFCAPTGDIKKGKMNNKKAGVRGKCCGYK